MLRFASWPAPEVVDRAEMGEDEEREHPESACGRRGERAPRGPVPDREGDQRDEDRPREQLHKDGASEGDARRDGEPAALTPGSVRPDGERERHETECDRRRIGFDERRIRRERRRDREEACRPDAAGDTPVAAPDRIGGSNPNQGDEQHADA